MTEQTKHLIDDVMTIGVPVSDQDRALAFYRDTLGFRTVRDVSLPQVGGRWIEVAPPSGSVTIALVPARPGVPAGVETGIRFTAADAGTVHTELRSRGVEVGEILRWPGVPAMFAFRDQDGNGHEIVEAA
ncbi:MAG TPA: VOC family protein [Solirubrobacteraceae bacterium]|nr:VOC family protein [Solirubrobacteraceae bacterium]